MLFLVHVILRTFRTKKKTVMNIPRPYWTLHDHTEHYITILNITWPFYDLVQWDYIFEKVVHTYVQLWSQASLSLVCLASFFFLNPRSAFWLRPIAFIWFQNIQYLWFKWFNPCCFAVRLLFTVLWKLMQDEQCHSSHQWVILYLHTVNSP